MSESDASLDSIDRVLDSVEDEPPKGPFSQFLLKRPLHFVVTVPFHEGETLAELLKANGYAMQVMQSLWCHESMDNDIPPREMVEDWMKMIEGRVRKKDEEGEKEEEKNNEEEDERRKDEEGEKEEEKNNEEKEEEKEASGSVEIEDDVSDIIDLLVEESDEEPENQNSVCSIDENAQSSGDELTEMGSVPDEDGVKNVDTNTMSGNFTPVNHNNQEWRLIRKKREEVVKCSDCQEIIRGKFPLPAMRKHINDCHSRRMRDYDLNCCSGRVKQQCTNRNEHKKALRGFRNRNQLIMKHFSKFFERRAVRLPISGQEILKDPYTPLPK